MSAQNYADLIVHSGHSLVIAEYASESAAIECQDCAEVLLDFDQKAGECDTCGDTYDIGESSDRCGDCGNCSDCCTHETEEICDECGAPHEEDIEVIL